MWPFARTARTRCDQCHASLGAVRIHTGGGDAYCSPRCATVRFGFEIAEDGRVQRIMAEEWTEFADLDAFLRSNFYHFRLTPREMPHAG